MIMIMKIKSLQHAINRKNYLERFLKSRPQEAVYIGDSFYAEQAVEQENRHNEFLEKKVREEIVKCERYIKNNLPT